MRPPVQQNREHDFGIMTPMIDIVFLLLVFFVVSAAGQVAEALLPAELPESGAVASEAASDKPLPLVIDVWLRLNYDTARQQTTVDMNGTLYDDLDRLKEQLRALAEIAADNPIVLDISPDVPMGDVIDLYDACQASGFLSVDFALDIPAAEG